MLCLQGIRVYNQLLFQAHHLGYLLPDLPKVEDSDKFQVRTRL